MNSRCTPWEIVKTIQMKCGQAYVVSLDQKQQLIELGDVFLPNENRQGTRPFRFADFGRVDDCHKRVMTVCTMAGCCGSCAFCSVRRTFQRKLTRAEIVAQVDFLLEAGLKHGRAGDPCASREFHVLYTRMGEPSLNIENVIGSIYDLRARYPHVKIGMSTFGRREGVQQFLRHAEIAPHIMMQFSAHGTSEDVRSRLLGLETGKQLMSLEEIGRFVKAFRRLNPRMVSLNFILLKGVHYDFSELKRWFGREDIYIRLSPLNDTGNSGAAGLEGLLQEEDVLSKAPLSSPELKAVMANLKESGFAYAYAPAIDEEIRHQAACGQALETLKKSRLESSSVNAAADSETNLVSAGIYRLGLHSTFQALTLDRSICQRGTKDVRVIPA